jgi:hypothetical protein
VCTAHSTDITCAEGTVFGHVPASYNRDFSLGLVKKQRPELPAGADLSLFIHLRLSG